MSTRGTAEEIYVQLRANGAVTLTPKQVWVTATLRKFAGRQGFKIRQIKQITDTTVYLIHPDRPLEQHAPDREQP